MTYASGCPTYTLVVQCKQIIKTRLVESHSGARENILGEPQTFYEAPLWRKFVNFSP